MNSLFKILFFLIFSFKAYGIEVVEWQLCRLDNSCITWEKVKNHYLNNLTFPIEKKIKLKANIKCSQTSSHSDLGLYLSTVHDSYSLKFNGKYIQHFKQLFLSNEATLIQIPRILCKRKNILELNIYDLNGAVIGLSEKTLIGNYTTLYWKSKVDYFFKTGLTLLGSYVLIHMSFLVLIFLIFKPHKRLMMLLIFSVTAAFYLLSFSEVPRAFYKPMLMSGAIHFLLLMLQGFTLLLLIKSFFNRSVKLNWLFNVLTLIYLIFISIYVYNIYSGEHSYHQQIVTVLFAAPLVLAPSIYALTLISTQYFFDKALILTFSWCLFICQLNDLLVFWKVYPGFFTIKFYLPIITIFFTMYHFRKLARVSKESDILAAKAKSTFHVLHDLKIPLDLLQNLISYGPDAIGNLFPILQQSVQRLNELSKDLLDQTKKPEKIDLTVIIKSLIQEQVMAYNVHVSNFKVEIPDKLIFVGHVSSINRTISNLLKNAVEASLPLNENIFIKLEESPDFVIIKIFNKGTIINSTVLQNISEGIKVHSERGHGLGLQQVLSCCKIFGWKLTIKPLDEGTQATLMMQKIIHL